MGVASRPRITAPPRWVHRCSWNAEMLEQVIGFLAHIGAVERQAGRPLN
jgi:hypothetical protein